MGSAMRPLPTSPQARSPASGPIWRMPRSFNVATLAWVAPWVHIMVFMAGAFVGQFVLWNHDRTWLTCSVVLFACALVLTGWSLRRALRHTLAV